MALERDELDERLGGGLPTGALVLLEGAPGAGKSVLCQRLAYGAVENGHSVAFVSSELTAPQFLGQMRSLAYPAERRVIAGDLAFTPVHSLVLPRARGPLLPRLLRAPHLFARDLLFVDSLSFFFAEAAERGVPPSGIAAMTAELVRLAKRRNAAGTTLVLAADPGETPRGALEPLRGACDAYVELRTEVIGVSVARSLLLKRYSRPARSVGDVVGFRVEPGAGFIVEIRAVS